MYKLVFKKRRKIMKILLNLFCILIATAACAQETKVWLDDLKEYGTYLDVFFVADTAIAGITVSRTIEDYDTTEHGPITATDNQHLRSTLSLMYNYKMNQIETIDLRHFCLSDVQVYLKQTERALSAYTWMRKNRPKYSILKCVILVNAWHRIRDKS